MLFAFDLRLRIFNNVSLLQAYNIITSSIKISVVQSAK